MSYVDSVARQRYREYVKSVQLVLNRKLSLLPSRRLQATSLAGRIYGLHKDSHGDDLEVAVVAAAASGPVQLRKVLCEIATQVFNISPSVLVGVG